MRHLAGLDLQLLPVPREPLPIEVVELSKDRLIAHLAPEGPRGRDLEVGVIRKV